MTPLAWLKIGGLAAAALAAYLYVLSWYEKGKAVGERETEARVEAGVKIAGKLADDRYAIQLQGVRDARDRFEKDATDARARADAADGRMRDYAALLRSRASPAAAGPAGGDGDASAIVRFRLGDYERFTATAVERAKLAEADAIELKLCLADDAALRAGWPTTVPAAR